MENPNCQQVINLLELYINGKLSPILANAIEFHLNICPKCRKKYFELKTEINNVKDKPKIHSNRVERQIEHYIQNLSAYIDNELDDKDNIKIRKLSIVNTQARQKLEDILYFRQMLQNSFDKTKNNLKKDYSEEIIHRILNSGRKRINSEYVSLVISTLFLIFWSIEILYLYN